jgi:hypothetical protein
VRISRGRIVDARADLQRAEAYAGADNSDLEAAVLVALSRFRLAGAECDVQQWSRVGQLLLGDALKLGNRPLLGEIALAALEGMLLQAALVPVIEEHPRELLNRLQALDTSEGTVARLVACLCAQDRATAATAAEQLRNSAPGPRRAEAVAMVELVLAEEQLRSGQRSGARLAFERIAAACCSMDAKWLELMALHGAQKCAPAGASTGTVDRMVVLLRGIPEHTAEAWRLRVDAVARSGSIH